MFHNNADICEHRKISQRKVASPYEVYVQEYIVIAWKLLWSIYLKGYLPTQKPEIRGDEQNAFRTRGFN